MGESLGEHPHRLGQSPANDLRAGHKWFDVDPNRERKQIMKSDQKQTPNQNLMVALYLLAGAGIWPASGAILNVPAEYPTIQGAISAAQNGDTVQVAAGTYYERLSIGRAITLLGAGADVTVVNAAATATDPGCPLQINGGGSGAWVEGFTLTGGNTGPSIYGGGVRIHRCSPTLVNNVIKGNITSGNGGGIIIVGFETEASPLLIGNVISENTAGNTGGGIWLWSASITMINNVVSKNTAFYGGGIYTMNEPWYRQERYELRGNTFEENTAGSSWSAFLLTASASPASTGIEVLIKDNLFKNNHTDAEGTVGLHNACGTVENNRFEGNSAQVASGIRISAGLPTLPALGVSANTFKENFGQAPIYVLGQLNVDATPPRLVGNTVVGNSAGVPGAYVSGIYLYCCQAVVENNEIRNNSGAKYAVWIKYYASPTMTGNLIESNLCGEAVVCFDRSSGTMENNQLSENGQSITGIKCDESSPIIRGNTLKNSQYYREGVWCIGSSPTITENQITNNSQAGIILDLKFVATAPGPSSQIPSEPLIHGNTLSGTFGVLCQDTAAANAETIAQDNSFGPVHFQVQQWWRPMVQVVYQDGTPTGGASVRVTDRNDYLQTFVTRSDGYIANPIRYDQWPHFVEYNVDGNGTKLWSTPYSIAAILGDLTGGAFHSWNGRYQTVQVVLNPQNIPPVARCRDVTVSAGADCTAATASVDDGSFDPDAGDTITLVQSPAAPYPLGTTPVTLTVTDSHGASSFCAATVTVVDTTPPSITAPGPVTVGTDAGKCEASNVALGETVAADNCGGVTIVNDAPTVFPKGVTLVIWTAADTAGNPASATQTVTVNDTENPTIIAPPDVFIASDAGDCGTATVALGQATTADNCDVASVVNDHPSAAFPLGETLVTWTVTDTSGLTASVEQKVTVLKSVSLPVQPPLAPEPVANKIRLGQVVPHKVAATDCSGVLRTTGVTVSLKVQGIDSANNTVFQDVLEEANGQGNDGTVTSDGIMQLVGNTYQFNLDTSNFNDPNTLGSARYYRSTITVMDNATLTVLGTVSAILETRD